MSDEAVKYGWSRDEEGYHGRCDSREQAMSEAVADTHCDFDDYTGDGDTMTIWTAIAGEVDLADHLPNEEWIIEQVIESLSEEVGEWAENFEPTREQMAKFCEGMAKAIHESGMVAGCYAARDVQEHQVDKDGNEVKDG